MLAWTRNLAIAGLAVAAIRAVAVRRRALQPVAADLRTPLVFLPIAPGSERHLRLVRRLMQREFRMPVADGVAIESTNVDVEDRTATRVLRYEHPERERPSAALLWIHGGGTVIGRPEQGNTICSRWAGELGIFVASVDYRLAPEHPFPNGLEDCYTALRWLHEHADEFGIDRERIAVGGDSAGGLLAASLCQVARDRGGPRICFQLLEYPMLDDRTVLLPDPGRSRSFVWSPAASRFGWTSYLGQLPTEHDARLYAAPSRSPDLANLPPAWIGVGDIDLLHDEAVEYAARLRDASVPCELHVERGMYHGADSIRPGAPTSRRFQDTMTAALAASLPARTRSASQAARHSNRDQRQ
jgi:acetyl esterase/lipase